MTQNDIYLFHFSLVQNLPFTCRSFSYEMPIFNQRLQLSVGGIVVSIAAFQAVDPGSIPGHRKGPFLKSSHEMFLCDTRSEKKYGGFIMIYTTRRWWYSGEHSCLPSS